MITLLRNLTFPPHSVNQYLLQYTKLTTLLFRICYFNKLRKATIA